MQIISFFPNPSADDAGAFDEIVESLSLVEMPAELAYQRITRIVSRQLSVSSAAVTLLDPAQERVELKGAQGFSSRQLADDPLSPIFLVLARQVARADGPVVHTDLADDAYRESCTFLRRDGLETCARCADFHARFRAYLGVPVHGMAGRPVGALAAFGAEPRVWSDDDIALLTDLAEGVSDELRLRSALSRGI